MQPDKPDDRSPAETAGDPDLVGADAAMHRAARRVRRRAAENGTPIPVFEDGEVVWVKVDAEAESLRTLGGARLSGRRVTPRA